VTPFFKVCVADDGTWKRGTHSNPKLSPIPIGSSPIPIQSSPLFDQNEKATERRLGGVKP